MKKIFGLMGIFLSVIIFALFLGCASTPKVNNDLVGTWFCKIETGEDMEISLSGDGSYNIKIDGVDNSKGNYTLTQRYGSSYIIFNIKEYINENNRWKKPAFFLSPHLDYSYKIENGNLVLIGGIYRGTYTQQIGGQIRNQIGGINVNYNVNINGKPAGPFSIEELTLMAKTGQIDRDTLMWKEGMVQWQVAGSIEELSSIWKSPPPLPPQ